MRLLSASKDVLFPEKRNPEENPVGRGGGGTGLAYTNFVLD